MTETAFRTARLFKILGNPLRYRILIELYRAPRTPATLAVAVNRPLYAVSRALAVLRLTDLVSYRTAGPAPVYFPKQGPLLNYLLEGENLVRNFDRPEESVGTGGVPNRAFRLTPDTL